MGGMEHIAVQILLVDKLNDVGCYDEAAALLEELIASSSASAAAAVTATDDEERDELTFGLRLALCKVNFNSGLFNSAISNAEQLLDETVVSAEVESHDGVEDKLRHGMALNALALSRLGAVDFIGMAHSSSTEGARVQLLEDMLTEVEECRDIVMTATGMLRTVAAEYDDREECTSPGTTNYSALILASAASSNNAGIAQLLRALLLEQKAAATSAAHDTDADIGVAVDDAVSTWKEGLAQLDRIGEEGGGSEEAAVTADIIRARLHCNIAAALLGVDADVGAAETAERPKSKKLTEDDLKTASEHASKALTLCDGIINDAAAAAAVTAAADADGDGSSSEQQLREAMRSLSGRALHLVADCYGRAGSAVTAEGLLQSALELLDDDRYETMAGPLALLERREVYRTYAALMDNWDRRSRDADKMREKAKEMEDMNMVVDGWKGKPGIYSGLWMFTLGDFKY